MVKLKGTPRKWLLTLHLLFSAIMLGGAVAFLIMSITAANTSDEGMLKVCYTSMHVLANTSVKASTIGALVYGVLAAGYLVCVILQVFFAGMGLFVNSDDLELHRTFANYFEFASILMFLL